MKVLVSQAPLKNSNRTRGVGTYTRELTKALQDNFPTDQFLSTSTGKGVDLVHFPFFDPFSLTLPFRQKTRSIVTIHDTIPLRFPEHFPRGIRGSIKLLIQKRILSSIDHVITDSEASKADITSYLDYPAGKITVTPLAPGLDRSTKTISDQIKKEYALPNRYILYVGDINWNKNITGLIEAFGALKSARTHLVLVGKVFSDKPDIPEYRKVVDAIKASPKQDLIHQLGYIPQHHLPLLYRLATVYVQPSWYEGFGLPVLEAMQLGCPVLSSNQGSLPEVGGDAVSYFNPHKKSSLTKELHNLLTKPSLRKQLVSKGLARAKLFSWEQTATLTHAVYEKVLA